LAEIQAIQREERRNGEQVMQLARTQAARALEYAAKALIPGESDESAGLDGSQRTAKAGEAGVAGKLERAEPDTLIIRDGSGFEYWLKASDNTQVTYNGKRARLTDFKQGAEAPRFGCQVGRSAGDLYVTYESEKWSGRLDSNQRPPATKWRIMRFPATLCNTDHCKSLMTLRLGAPACVNRQ